MRAICSVCFLSGLVELTKFCNLAWANNKQAVKFYFAKLLPGQNYAVVFIYHIKQ